jgi:hypothetical protein
MNASCCALGLLLSFSEGFSKATVFLKAWAVIEVLRHSHCLAVGCNVEFPLRLGIFSRTHHNFIIFLNISKIVPVPLQQYAG